MPFLPPPPHAFPRPRALFGAHVEYPRRAKRDFWLGTPSGTLVVTRQELTARGALLTASPPRALARVQGMQSEDESGTIPTRIRLSPDGSCLALTCGKGYFQVVRGTDARGVWKVGPGKDAPGSHPVLILDARSGRVLGRAVFEGRCDYAWSPDSRRLAILALSLDYQRSTVYTLGGNRGLRLVRRDASRFLWTEKGLVTALWRKGARIAPYGEMYQAFGNRWRDQVPDLLLHAAGARRRMTLKTANRLLGVPGTRAALWSPSPVFARETIPDPRGPGLLLVGSFERLPTVATTLPDGSRDTGYGAGETQSVDTVYRHGKRITIRHPAFQSFDSGNGVFRAWNLGGGIYAYASTGDHFVRGDGERAGLAAIRLPEGNRSRRERRYWGGIQLDPYGNTEILWR